MNKIFARSFLIILSTVLVTILSAWPIPVQAEEMTLRFLVWEGYAPKKRLEIFQAYIEQKYKRKLKTKISFVSNSDSFYNPVRGKSVDVISPPYHMFNDQRWALIKKGLILPLDMDNIPNFKDISPGLRNAAYFSRDEKKYAVPLAQGPYGLVYNTKLVKKAPESWNVLWEPEYKGKYVIAKNEYMNNCLLTALALGYSRENIYKFEILNNNQFKKKLVQLAQNAHSFWDGIDKSDDLFGHALGTSWGFALKDLKKKGEIWKMASPAEGTVYWVDNYSITWSLKDKPLLRKIAEEWLNYTLSPEFQVDVIIRDLSCFPVTANIKDRVTMEEKKAFHIDAPEEYQKNRISEPDLSHRDRHGLEKFWNDALEERMK